MVIMSNNCESKVIHPVYDPAIDREGTVGPDQSPVIIDRGNKGLHRYQPVGRDHLASIEPVMFFPCGRSYIFDFRFFNPQSVTPAV